MTEIKRILCPVDFSSHSRRALDHAVAMARWYGARLTALYVFAPATPPSLGPTALEPLAVSLADRDAVMAEVRAFVRPELTPDVPLDLVVRQGLPAAEIVAQAESGGADLLVLGTHGRSGFERFVLGSVTERVLHKVSCAVLTVPPALAEAPSAAGLVKRILCAIDFSDCSMGALEHAMSLAQEADARLVLLHVVAHEIDDTAELALASTGPHHMSIDEFREARDAELRQRLEGAVPDTVRTYCQVDTMLAHGMPWREILRVADEQQSDLIVMGVRGRSRADLAIFGSTTHHVVRRATCPVLTLKEHRGDEYIKYAEAVEE